MINNLFPKITHILGRVYELDPLIKLFALILAFFAPLNFMFAVMLFFVTADTFSGIYRSYRRNKDRYQRFTGKHSRITCWGILWKSYDQNKFEKSLGKVLSYPIILTVFYVFDKLVLGIQLPEDQFVLNFSFTNYMFVLIAAMDLRSFVMNMGEATQLNVWVVAKNILNKKIGEIEQ